MATISLLGKRAPPVVKERASQLRNDAIHGGKYPDANEAVALAGEIFKSISEIEKMLDEVSERRPSLIGRHPSKRNASRV